MRRGLPALVAGMVLVLGTALWPAAANPPGVPDGLKLEFSFNMIGTPGDYEGGCGEGHRIFVQRDANHEHVLVRDHDDGWHIEWCDATFGDTAELHTDEAGTYDLYVRILGKPGGQLTICADTLEDHATGEHLCLLDSFTLNREGSKSSFQVRPDSLFDAELEDLIWSVWTNSDFRIAQFRVYAT